MIANFRDYTGHVAHLGAQPTDLILRHKLILLHRSDVAETGIELARWYLDNKGWPCPYHFLVLPDGMVQQLVPLKHAVPGAWKANRYAVQVALKGDFRKRQGSKPTLEQLAATDEIVAAIKMRHWGIKVEGHTAKPLRSKDPLKKCPGKLLDVKGIDKRSTWLVNQYGQEVTPLAA